MRLVTQHTPFPKTPMIFKIVMLAIAAMVLCGLLSSCVTEKKRAKICATCTLKETKKDSVSVKDSVALTVTTKTVEVTIHDTLKYYIQNPCADLCDSLGRLKAFKKEIISDKGARLQIFSRDNKIYFNDVIDSLKQVAHYKDTAIAFYRNVSRFKETKEQVPARCDREHKTNADGFWIVTGKSLSALFILLLLAIGARYYIKNHLP